MNFKFVLPIIYINFDIIQTKLEVNQTKIGHFIPKKLQKISKMSLPQNPFCLSVIHQKAVLLHFSINLSETFSIDVKMKA